MIRENNLIINLVYGNLKTMIIHIWTIWIKYRRYKMEITVNNVIGIYDYVINNIVIKEDYSRDPRLDNFVENIQQIFTLQQNKYKNAEDLNMLYDLHKLIDGLCRNIEFESSYILTLSRSRPTYRRRVRRIEGFIQKVQIIEDAANIILGNVK